MSQDETRAASDPSAAVRTLSVLHNLHLVHDDPAYLGERLSQHRRSQRDAAELSLAALPADLAQRVRGALDGPDDADGLIRDAARFAETGARLAAAFEALLGPYDSMLSAMALQGRQALASAVRYEGRERDEELKDARRLFKGVLDHPIGARNHAIWFEYGWALLQAEAPMPEAEEAFYQAQRLGGSAHDDYRPLALRCLALALAAQARDTEARATLGRLTPDDASDAVARIEAARYAVRTGQEDDALAAVDAACTEDTSAASAVLADNDLRSVHVRVAMRLVARTEDARKAAEAAGLRLTRVRRVVGDIESRLSVTVEGPEGEPLDVDISRLGLDAALRHAEQARQDAVTLSLAAGASLDAEQARAQGEIDRLERFLAQALRERSYWEGSLRNIEEEAQLAGFSLHPYTFNNPFKRKQNLRAEQARLLYEQCKANFAQSEAFVASQQSRVDSEVQRYRQRLETIEDLRAVLDGQA